MLDALKGICIIFVVITHFRWTEELRLLLFFPFTIHMAVPIFMLISGYVYAVVYKEQCYGYYTGMEHKTGKKSFFALYYSIWHVFYSGNVPLWFK
jgi:fucose 4-O-acetylase-like acetyltransferase